MRCVPENAKEFIYPNGQYLPKEGVQRGTLYVKNGDPLTPEYPSIRKIFSAFTSIYTYIYIYILYIKASAYRRNESDHEKLGLPNIPAQVIGYGLAEKIFRLLENNKKVYSSWNGELNTSYTYGGKLDKGR